MVLFVALIIKLTLLLFRLIKHRFAVPNKNREFIALFAIETLTFLFPYGLIDFKKYEGKDLISAQREGVANCMMYLHLKEGGEFVEKQICFGVYEQKGSYQIKGDSIFFHFEADRTGIDKPALGIIINDKFSEPLSKTMLYFKNRNDSTPLRLEVFKYDLPKH